ncbi:MAG: serine protein kinase [Epulopiscium sp. Nele67-Bin005]|nr:MAG: serine protein kinase [Epulopiscium sp. Nele67-Bin005]
MDFMQIILEEKNANKIESFNGTFLDYLNIVYQNKDIVQLSHEKMYKLLIQGEVDIIKTEEDLRLRRIYGNSILKKYPVFKDKFFGIDDTLMKLVQYFYTASMGGEEARQILYLVGPVGAGKSSLVDALKSLLETSDDIYSLEGCPMQEEPLHLIPYKSRKRFEEILGVQIEGELCPVCSYRLQNEFNGDYEKFPVEQIKFSIKDRKGIGVVPPVDANNQDTSVLTGSINISKMDLYSEDDPRVFSLNGAFNVANRGMIEFIEVFKNDAEYLYTMITATQEKLIPSPAKGSMIYFDGIIIAHSNETEWTRFRTDSTNEAILDRIVRIDVPYCLELDEEVKIYKKHLSKSKFRQHIAPHTLEMVGMFAILTRLSPSTKVEPLTKLKIYNGEEIINYHTETKINIYELKEEAPREGMSGISTRFIMKVIDNTLVEASCDCIWAVQILEKLIQELKQLPISNETKKYYLSIIQDVVKQEYNRILEEEITKSFVYSFREQAETLFNNYLDHAEAYTNKTTIKDFSSNLEFKADEKFLRSIEEQIGVNEGAARGFRQDVTSYMFALIRSGQSISYKCYEPLKEAIEKRLTSSIKELTRIITSSHIRNNEQGEKYNVMIEQMKQSGYCEHCCDKVLNYATYNLWKD